MSINLAWLWLTEAELPNALARLKVTEGESVSDLPDEFGLCLRRLPTGHAIIVNSEIGPDGFPEIGDFHISGPSIVCLVAEAGNYCHVSGRDNGVEIWSISHNGGDAIDDLQVTGELPIDIEPLRQSALEKIRDSNHTVDHMFSVPIRLAFDITGFFHARADNEFTELVYS